MSDSTETYAENIDALDVIASEFTVRGKVYLLTTDHTRRLCDEIRRLRLRERRPSDPLDDMVLHAALNQKNERITELENELVTRNPLANVRIRELEAALEIDKRLLATQNREILCLKNDPETRPASSDLYNDGYSAGWAKGDAQHQAMVRGLERWLNESQEEVAGEKLVRHGKEAEVAELRDRIERQAQRLEEKEAKALEMRQSRDWARDQLEIARNGTEAAFAGVKPEAATAYQRGRRTMREECLEQVGADTPSLDVYTMLESVRRRIRDL